MKKDKPTKPAAKKPKRHAPQPEQRDVAASTPPATAAAPPPDPTPAAAAPAPPAPPAPPRIDLIQAPSRVEIIEVPRPEEGIPLALLRAALRFVLPAAATKGELCGVIFGYEDGFIFVATRSRYRSHVAYIKEARDWRLRGTAQPAATRKVERLLSGVDDDDEAVVIASPLGALTIRRLGQPAIPHQLDLTPTVLDWRPPPDLREATAIPLQLSADHLVKAVRYPGGTVEIEQRTSARAVLTITVDGTLVARAIIAEQGHELYPEPPAPPPPPPAQPLLRGLTVEGPAPRKPARATTPAAVPPAAPTAPTMPAPANDAGSTAPSSDAFPTPTDDVQVVLGLTAAAWARLDERTREMLSALAFLSLADVGDGERASGPLAPAEVAAVVAILAADGLRCVDVTHGDPDDEERFEEWTVDVAPAPGELPPFPTPGERPVVFEVPEMVWAGLSSVQVRGLDGLAAQATPMGVEPWYRIGEAWRTGPMTAAVAVRLGRKLASWGLRCEEKGGESRRDGVVLDLWRVGRVGERKGAAV